MYFFPGGHLRNKQRMATYHHPLYPRRARNSITFMQYNETFVLLKMTLLLFTKGSHVHNYH